ncbi:MAG: hypothetical protein C0448_05665 [Sphingobacteriaceae bacterium]|nr:hypothetical protein [Sphingobacteriaceae bacterium]
MKFLTIFFSCIGIFILFILAHAFCEGIWINGFQLKKEIDLMDFSTLIFSSFVTIATGWYIGKKVTENRYEKDYFIQDLKNIERDINNVLNNTQSDMVEISLMTNLMNQLNTNIELFSSTVNIFDKSLNIDDLKTKFRLLYTKTTDSDSNYLLLDDSNRNEISQLCSSFIKETRILICKINKQ